MFIRNIITGVIVSVPFSMFAQNPQIDTIPHYDLQEVVVSAPKVLHKADMDLFIPSPDAKALSKNEYFSRTIKSWQPLITTMKFTRQYDAMDCGPACVRMMASAHGKLFPLAWLRSQACLTKEGVSVAGIRRALGEVKMESGAFRMTLDELEAKCPLPAILHWNQNSLVP